MYFSHPALQETIEPLVWIKVINVGGDTFGNPISKGLTNLAIILDYKRPGMLWLAFASSSQSAEIGLSKWIFYVKNHSNLSEDFTSMFFVKMIFW